MATISPGELEDVEGVGDPVAAAQFNFEVLTRQVWKYEPTYVSGVATTTVGPPTTGAHILNEKWVDALGSPWKCTSAGTPGSWLQQFPAVVETNPTTGTIPTGYLTVRRVLNDVGDWGVYQHLGSYSWRKLTLTYSDLAAQLEGADWGLVYVNASSEVKATETMEGIVLAHTDGAPTTIQSLTENRLARIDALPFGFTVVDSLFRDNGTQTSVGTDPITSGQGANVFQVFGAMTIKADTTQDVDEVAVIETDQGELTLNTGNSLSMNFKIGGANGWRIRPESILESIGAQTIRSSTGNFIVATGAANGNVLVQPHGTGKVGIGNNTTIGALLHVYSGASGVAASAGGQLVLENSSGAFATVLSPNSGFGAIYMGCPTSNTRGGIGYTMSSFSGSIPADTFFVRTAGNERFFFVGSAGNFGIGMSAFGTSGAKVLGISSGTAPTTSPADAVQMWAADFDGAAGKASIHMLSEDGSRWRFGNQGISTFSDTTTNATTKNGRLGTAHYTNSEEPLAAILFTSTTSTCVVMVGGGSSLFNAATTIEFYTAANNTTTTGTKRAEITSDGRMGIGASPTAAAILDLQSTTMAFMPPRMNTTQRDAITGVAGMVIYNTSTNKLNVYTTAWEAVTSA
jgi:hypothetical protein